MAKYLSLHEYGEKLRQITESSSTNMYTWDEFPYRERLRELFDDHQLHVELVLMKMNQLLSKQDDRLNLFYDKNDKNCGVDRNAFNRMTGAIFDREDENDPHSRGVKEHWKEFDNLLLFSALYHDIGKVISLPRHSGRGEHLLEIVEQHETKSVKNEILISESQDAWLYYNFFMGIVRYHDLIGNLATGEASRPALLEFIRRNYRGNKADAKVALSGLTLLGLADIAGSIPNLSIRTGGLVAEEWRALRDVLHSSGENFNSIRLNLIKGSQETECAIDRIKRLLVAYVSELIADEMSGGKRGEVLNQDGWDHAQPFLATISDEEYIEDEMLRFHRSWESFRDFSRHFALVCKFDYLKKFIKELIRYGLNRQKPFERIIEVITGLLHCLVEDYSDLVVDRNVEARLIGIDVSAWTTPKGKGATSGDSLIRDRLIEVLYEDLRAGLFWASDEATVYFFR